MCENNCEAINLCEGTKVVPVTLEDAKQAYINSLLGDITKLQADLETEKFNCGRFQQLYQVCLAYIMLAINKNDINELAGVTKKLAEIEAK